MRIIYGTKVLIEKDLFENCGRPINLIQLVTDNLDSVLEDLDDVCLFFMHRGTYQSAQFNFRFIPLNVIEQYILYKSVKSNAEDSIKNMATNSTRKYFDQMIEIAKDRLDSLIKEYTDLELRKLEYETCMTFIFDENDKLKDICLAIPELVVSKINTLTEYTCTKCGATKKTDILPEDMYYRIHDGQVIYYCNNCVSDYPDAVHVGDIYGKEIKSALQKEKIYIK